MNDTAAQKIHDRIKDFHLPRYREIPDVGLFLDQTVRMIESYLEPFPDMGLTASMISNYVKHKLIAHPVKKLYGRDQIAMLLFIAVAKTVLPLDDVRRFLARQQQEYSNAAAYDCFCGSFEETLREIFSGGTAPVPASIPEESDLQTALRYMLTAASCRLFLETFMAEAFPDSLRSEN